jgi:hypothetical protein
VAHTLLLWHTLLIYHIPCYCGTIGIELSDASDSTITNSEVYDVGCTGLRATGGEAATLRAGI